MDRLARLEVPSKVATEGMIIAAAATSALEAALELMIM